MLPLDFFLHAGYVFASCSCSQSQDKHDKLQAMQKIWIIYARRTTVKKGEYISRSQMKWKM